MSFIRTTGKLGIVFSVFAISLLVSNASAQDQTYECADTYNAVRQAPARRYKAKRNYYSVRTRTVVRPVTEIVYVPVREVVYDDRSVYANGIYGGRATDRDYYDTRRIASDYGYKDGFYDGHQAGMERDAYHPENSGDYQKATNGYEDDFGNKNVYRQAYRRAYLRGYNSGWRSVAQSRSYRPERW